MGLLSTKVARMTRGRRDSNMRESGALELFGCIMLTRKQGERKEALCIVLNVGIRLQMGRGSALNAAPLLRGMLVVRFPLRLRLSGCRLMRARRSTVRNRSSISRGLPRVARRDTVTLRCRRARRVRSLGSRGHRWWRRLSWR